MSHVNFENSVLINPTENIIELIEDSVDLTSNPSDLYSFSLQGNRFVEIYLSNLSTDADLYLYDSTSNENPIAVSGFADNMSEFVSKELQAGTYFIEVRAYSGSTNYALEIILSYGFSFDDDNSLESATLIDLDNNFEYNNTNSVNMNSDISDFYTFQLSTNTSVEIELSDLSADAGLILYGTDETSYFSDVSGFDSEFISEELTPGQYFLQVYTFSGETNYTLNVTSSDTNNSESLKLEAGTAQIAYVAYYGRPPIPVVSIFGTVFFNKIILTILHKAVEG